MRALVYAAGAYALCMGTAEAFAPQTAVPASTTLTKVKDSHVGERSAPAGALSAWQPYGGYVPESQRAQQPQQVEPMGGQSPMTAAATLEHAYAAPAADKPQSVVKDEHHCCRALLPTSFAVQRSGNNGKQVWQP